MKNIKYILILLFYIAASEIQAMDKPHEVDKDIVNAEFELRFASMESGSDQEVVKASEGTHAWAKQIIDDYNKGISFKRRLRIDFILRNVPLQNPTLLNGKFEYKIFSIRWPTLNIVELNKQTRHGSMVIVTNYGCKDTNVLVEGVGNFFQSCAFVSEPFDMSLKSEKILKRFSDPVYELYLLDKPDNVLEISIVTPHKFPKDRNYNIRGYCLLSGGIINAVRNAFWFPFDTYSVPLDFFFPFKQTDIALKLSPLEGFSVRIEIPHYDSLQNLKAEFEKPTNLSLIIKRDSIIKQYVAPFLAVIFTLLNLFWGNQRPTLRILTYLATITTIYFFSSPVDAISAYYPLRIGLALLVGSSILISEYFEYLKRHR
jgi:hypothetical protein